MMNDHPHRTYKLETQYVPAEKDFLINFGSKTLKAIRINLPEPPPNPNEITGYGLQPHEQKFERLKFPDKIVQLEKECYDYFKSKRDASNYDVQERFWDQLRIRAKELAEEIVWMKHFIWHMHNGYWCYIDGQPTYIPGWHFSYLHLHWMTLEKSSGYPEFSIRQNRRFQFREYIYNTTETFADLDENGVAYKVDGKYRMKDLGQRTFIGTIEPKGRREGLTNEFCHIITRIMTETKGADNLGTIVSMDGNNAETHFKKKLLPAFKKWPIWLKPIWKGGVTDIVFDVPKGVLDPNVNVLGSTINYTDSGSDLANDGKKIMAAGFDEQGKGKRVGNVGNRWQINKETMTLGAGTNILGYCTHPSTVEKMDEGGLDYKEMCDMSDFYTRTQMGQTISGLAVSYMPSSFCLRGYTDVFGKPVLHRPTDRQRLLGYDKEIGSQTYIQQRRRMLYDEKNPKKMEEYRSFVRKFPEEYSDCWKGVAGYIGFPTEQTEDRLLELELKPEHTNGRLKWVNDIRFGNVEFIHDSNGPWEVAYIPKPMEANLKATMDYYSAFEGEYVPMYRPLRPTTCIIGVDPHEFHNEGDAKRIADNSKLSKTGITVVMRRNKLIDKNDFDRKGWTTQRAVATYEEHTKTNVEAAEQALMAAIFWGGLINLERNKTEILSRLIEWKYGGYLNHNTNILPSGEIQIDPNAGTHLMGENKKKLFSYTKDQLTEHVHVEPLPSVLKQAAEISSMEQLTKYDRLASYMHGVAGLQSVYAEMLESMDDNDVDCLGITGRAV